MSVSLSLLTIPPSSLLLLLCVAVVMVVVVASVPVDPEILLLSCVDP